MSKPFKLNSAFKPSGDQPEAIRRLEEGLEDGLAHQTLLGVTGSGKTFTIANVIADLQRPTMVLAPNKTLAAQLYGEMKEFFPDNAVEYFVSYYDYYQPEAYVPSSDTFIEKDASVNEHIEQMRLSATKALLERRDVVVVASVSAIYGLGDPDLYLKMMLHLTVGMIIDQRAILRRLAELQYTRNDMAFTRGTFRVRGDTVEDTATRVIDADQHDDVAGVATPGNLKNGAIHRSGLIAGAVDGQWCAIDIGDLGLKQAVAQRDPARLAALPAGVEPCGENGEFHTLAFDGPMFLRPLAIRVGETVVRDGFVFTDLLPDETP